MGAPADSEPSLTASQESERAAPAGLGEGERDVVAGRYRLRSFIAEGGMGAVYVAEHALSKKKLALKVVHPYLCRGKQGVERFRREVSAAAEIDHPGIVQVYDAGVDDDGGFFMAMELLEGESLGDLLRRTWPGMATSVKLVEGMLEPLAKAHAKGFVHRDLKPDNIFVAKTDDGGERVKLLDFGLAREVDKGGPTRTGITFGTPEYMSPEQAMSARKVRAPGDVWAVGVMLYELLSGLHPFTGETPNAVMANAIKDPLPPLRDYAAHVPEPLARLVERCLEKDPDARPQTAGELLDELRAVLGAVTLDETVPHAPSPPTKWGSEEGSSDIPISSSYLVSERRGSSAATAAAVASMPEESRPAGVVSKRRLTLLVWAAVGALLLLGAGLVGFFLSGDAGEPVAVTEEPSPASPEPPPATPEVETGEAEAVQAEAVQAEAVEAPSPAPEETPEPAAEASPPPAVDPPAAEPRPAAPTPRRPRRSATEEAAQCAAGNDDCVIAALRRYGRTQAELRRLADLGRAKARYEEAMWAMRRYVRAYPDGPHAESYRTYLRNH